MPLICVCGLPGSGKSKRSAEILEGLREYISNDKGKSTLRTVEVVSDESLGIGPETYAERDLEKSARSQQMTAVKRLLSPSTVVILDNMSYIKGFRYQLYCEARTMRTPSIVVYVATTPEYCNREKWDGVNDKLFDQLVFRFEEPNGMARWDSPLFILLPEDKVPISEIWDALNSDRRDAVPVGITARAAPPADYVSVLNSTTTEVIREVGERARDAPASRIELYSRSLQLPLAISTAELNRLRRQFVGFNRTTPIPTESIAPFFVDFIAQHLNT